MNVVAEMLLSSPTPAVIWVTLMILTVPALLVLGNPHGLREPRRAFREIVPTLGRVADVAAEPAEEVRFADEMTVAAERASVAADRWRERWEQAEREQAAAWEAWLAADARLRHSLSAAAFGTPWSVRTCEEYAARERFLHRSVADAAGRGDLPGAAVADALAGRHGWDARLHAVEQELVVNRAAAAYRRQRYEIAVEAERTARHDAELARRSGVSLRQAQVAAVARSAAIGAVAVKRGRRTTSSHLATVAAA